MGRFEERYIYGSKEYFDTKTGNSIKSIRSTMYIEKDGNLVGTARDVYASEEISEMLFGEKDLESFNMFGYFSTDVPSVLKYESDNVRSSIELMSDGYTLYTSIGRHSTIQGFASIDEAIETIIDIQESDGYSYFEKSIKSSKDVTEYSYSSVLGAKKRKINKGNQQGGTRDVAKDLIKVKSSNVWAYSMRIPDSSDTGDLFVQFKNKQGGPGDIYQYFDVPIKLWQKFVSTGSKGHFFWKYVRNNYLYRKLTGDKKGKLPNAVA